MNPLYIFSLASAHTQWATTRQAVITGNIANANTSGYSVRDIEPFTAALDSAGGSSEAHTWRVSDTGARVALDGELVKADDVNRSFALDMTVMRVFHRMILESVKGGS